MVENMINKNVLDNKITVIIFSKNRPMQLYALLESIKKYTNFPVANINVLYKADSEFVVPMEQVKQENNEVVFHPEYSFKEQLTELVKNSNEYLVFFTDDDVFKDDADISQAISILEFNPSIFCFSLRLGKHLTYCYSTQLPQTVPDGATQEPFFVWKWKGSDWDWNYPFSVNGHIFRKKEFLMAFDNVSSWNSPNTLEGLLSHLHPHIPHPKMACFVTSKVFNIPHNRVQNEVQNIYNGGSEHELLDFWNQNKKIDISAFKNIKNISAHQVVEFKMIERK